MKRKYRTSALILALLMCLGMFVSCNKDTPADTTNSANVPESAPSTDTTAESTQNSNTSEGNTTDPTVPSKDSYVIKTEGASLNVAITRSQYLRSMSPITAQQQYLSNFLKDLLGTMPTLETDWRRAEDPESFEIIVGPTDHPETQSIMGSFTYGEWAVQAVGNKIIVLGYTETAIKAAMAHLVPLLRNGKNSDDNTITLNSSELNKKGTTTTPLTGLPIYDGGYFSTDYDAGIAAKGRQCDEVIITKTSLKEFDAYIEKLTANGFTVYNTNEVNKNKFATLNSATHTVNVGFYDYEDAVRITVEPLAPAYEISSEYTKVTTSNIIFLGIEPKGATVSGDYFGGLSMVLRLEDGRFIVIDGAQGSDSNKNTQNVDAFIALLKDQSKEYTTTPTVAAWILTHDHPDHVDMLEIDHQRITAAGIKVENIFASAASAKELKNSNAGWERFETIINQTAPALGANMHRMHVGQVMNYANCKIEVFYTFECWTDGYSPIGPGYGVANHLSVIFKTTLTDSATGKTTSVFNTGDASGGGMQKAANIFGADAVKSDIAVATHHGAGSGSCTQIIDALSKIQPTVTLFPRGTTKTTLGSFNLVASSANMVDMSKEVFFAGMCGDYTIIPVPYEYGKTVISSPNRLK